MNLFSQVFHDITNWKENWLYLLRKISLGCYLLTTFLWTDYFRAKKCKVRHYFEFQGSFMIFMTSNHCLLIKEGKFGLVCNTKKYISKYNWKFLDFLHYQNPLPVGGFLLHGSVCLDITILIFNGSKFFWLKTHLQWMFLHCGKPWNQQISERNFFLTKAFKIG